MTVLKQMVVVGLIALYLQPSLQASTRQIYDNVMLTSFHHTNEHNKEYYNKIKNADPYSWSDKMYEVAGSMKKGILNVAQDFYRDMHNDNLGYISKFIVGTSAGVIGGVSGGLFGVIAGSLAGFTIGAGEHYVERRFFSDDYTQQTKEWKKKQLRLKEEAKKKAKKLHT